MLPSQLLSWNDLPWLRGPAAVLQLSATLCDSTASYLLASPKELRNHWGISLSRTRVREALLQSTSLHHLCGILMKLTISSEEFCGVDFCEKRFATRFQCDEAIFSAINFFTTIRKG